MRIQVLTLPAVVVGEAVEEPFALVFDRIDEGSDTGVLQGKEELIKRQTGAVGVLFFAGEVEVP